MATTLRDTLISWLNDAYGMEQSLIQVLENHANDARNFRHVHSEIQKHLEVTRRHADLVKGCIEGLGGDVSTTKSAMGKMSGFFQGLSTGMAPDEMVKNALGDYASEHFEIACYKALIHTAHAAGHPEIVPTLEQILRDEEGMARWLDQNLPAVLDEYLAQPAGR